MIWALAIATLMPLAVALCATGLHHSLQGGATPDLVLVLVVLAARRFGLAGGALAGFWGGLWLGALQGNLAGPTSALYLLAGSLAGSHFESRRHLFWLESAALVAALYSAVAAGEMALLTGLSLCPRPQAMLVALAWQEALTLPLLGLTSPKRPEAARLTLAD